MGFSLSTKPTWSRSTECLGYFWFLFYSKQKHCHKFLRVKVIWDEKSNTWFSLLEDKTFDTTTQTNRIIHCHHNSQAMLNKLKSEKRLAEYSPNFQSSKRFLTDENTKVCVHKGIFSCNNNIIQTF